MEQGNKLERMPDNIRTVLHGLLEDLKSRESVAAVGLFGSRSRGDAVQSSDVDLLVVDKRDFDYEYVERAEIDNCFLDLNYVPEKWALKQIPPEIDQKLYEVEVLYDPGGALARSRDLLLKLYSKPERTEIRTGSCLVEADTYLSRGLSAYNKDDFQSAKANAAVAVEAIAKILIDVSNMPFSNSHFIRALESSSRKLGISGLYDDYLEIAGFSGLESQRTGKMLDSLVAFWKESIGFIELNSSALKTLHIRVLHNLSYYCKESFLKGMSAHVSTLINDGLFVEAAHYMSRTSISMLENFVWFVSTLENRRFDFTALFQHLKGSKTPTKMIYQKAAETFGVEEVSGREAEESLRKAKEIILDLRQKRKELIMGYLS